MTTTSVSEYPYLNQALYSLTARLREDSGSNRFLVIKSISPTNHPYEYMVYWSNYSHFHQNQTKFLNELNLQGSAFSSDPTMGFRLYIPAEVTRRFMGPGGGKWSQLTKKLTLTKKGGSYKSPNLTLRQIGWSCAAILAIVTIVILIGSIIQTVVRTVHNIGQQPRGWEPGKPTRSSTEISTSSDWYWDAASQFVGACRINFAHNFLYIPKLVLGQTDPQLK